MGLQLRRLSLTAHVTFSVGWLGAVVAFLALSIAGLTATSGAAVRGAYLAMDLIGLYVIVPMSILALATGLIEALGTSWGLLRHYWVLAKFIITVVATGLLLLHQFKAVDSAAQRVLGAATGTLPNAGALGMQLVVDASLAILALLTATALAIYKPRGLTARGRRMQQMQGVSGAPVPVAANDAAAPSLGLKILFAIIVGVVMVFVVMHLTGLSGHGHVRASPASRQERLFGSRQGPGSSSSSLQAEQRVCPQSPCA
jgi:hypothetical protein